MGGGGLYRIELSFGTVHMLVRQALAAREITSPAQILFLQRKAAPSGHCLNADQAALLKEKSWILIKIW